MRTDAAHLKVKVDLVVNAIQGLGISLPRVINQLKVPLIDLAELMDLNKQGLVSCYLCSIDKAEDLEEGLVDWLPVLGK